MIVLAGDKHLVSVQNVVRSAIIDEFESGRSKEEYPGELHDEISRQLLRSQRLLNQQRLYAKIENGKVVGTIGLDNPSEVIQETFGKFNVSGFVEVCMCYVHPQSQRKGYGSEMLKYLKGVIHHADASGFVLNAGFTVAIRFWEHALGKPTHVIPNQWGPGQHHCFWMIKRDG